LLPAGLTEYIPDTYIVAFTPEAGNAAAAAATLVDEVQTALQQQQQQQQQPEAAAAAATMDPSAAASDLASGDTAAAAGITLLKTIGQEPEVAPAAFDAAAVNDSAPPTRMQGAVVTASAEALQIIKASPLVKSVIQDQVIIAQPVTCVQQQFVGSGVATVPRSTFTWPGCYTSRAKLMWRGITCGDGSMTFCE
jgi:hypothetical protein